MSVQTIQCDGCGEYREWEGFTLLKGCRCNQTIGKPNSEAELAQLKSDLRKLVERWREHWEDHWSSRPDCLDCADELEAELNKGGKT